MRSGEGGIGRRRGEESGEEEGEGEGGVRGEGLLGSLSRKKKKQSENC